MVGGVGVWDGLQDGFRAWVQGVRVCVCVAAGVRDGLNAGRVPNTYIMQCSLHRLEMVITLEACYQHTILSKDKQYCRGVAIS